MATITITDETTREVLIRALWNVAVNHLGNTEDYVTWLDDSEGVFNESFNEVDARVAAYTSTITELRAAERCQLGGEVTITDPEFFDGLRALAEGLEESGAGVLQGLYDAAVTLCAELV